jgi:hypothetical protein
METLAGAMDGIPLFDFIPGPLLQDLGFTDKAVGWNSEKSSGTSGNRNIIPLALLAGTRPEISGGPLDGCARVA